MPVSDLRHTSWFQHAVFYEVMLRSYADGNGDGIGDFAGLTSRLDYLTWLGIDCLWIPPFFPSPWADGGYDVADYTDVAPDVGTLADFDAFVAAAHERGIRVIIDFVMNHTSAAHPWFQASRSDPDGPYGDFYVWRDDDREYPDARIIFLDTEPSNWSWDDVRQQYYWHRFFAHQPDLNFDNPAVVEAILDALRFWLERGVDGFRLDAVPYLVERPGTNGENLPETHAILKAVRRMCEAEFPDVALLCEANQWPDDIVEYFGDSDECHLAFHFPVMPRMYMALRREDRQCLSDILDTTPMIPEGCQWGTFLRNHDELTLEMVTPEDREYMWREYAPEPRMRANLGIRRRLASLLDNDPARIRLMHALLLALPGSPVLYYGDEIGMGDNIWLPDRDGVRTPMQWEPDDQTGGFSTAAPHLFPYPLLRDSDYRPSEVNVATQREDPASLLRWVRDMLALRRDHPLLSVGNYLDVGGSDPAVFAFLRSLGDTAVLCVFNLSDHERTTELDLSWLAGTTARHLWFDVEMEPPGEDPYSVTLPPHGYTWIALDGLAQERVEVWWHYLQQARWFAGRDRGGELVGLTPLPWLTPHRSQVPTRWPALRPVLTEVRYDDGTRESYQILASYRPVTDRGPQGIGVVNLDGYGPARCADISDDPEALGALALAMASSTQTQANDWSLAVDRPEGAPASAVGGSFVSGEQSNTSAVLGDVLVKIVRRIAAGAAVEQEALEALTDVPGVPGYRGGIVATHTGSVPVTLLVASDFVPGAQDGWDLALSLAEQHSAVTWARGLGTRLAQVHAGLAAAFGTQEESGSDIATAMVDRFDEAVTEVPALAEFRAAVVRALAPLQGRAIPVQRLHGDFHLGQTLFDGSDWHIIDFEGEPLKAASERRRPDSVDRDIAGLLRSIDYARASGPAAETPEARQWAERARAAFLDGYADGGGRPLDASGVEILRAYEVDKAIYEIVYEARHRPAWIQIPLRALANLVREEPDD